MTQILGLNLTNYRNTLVAVGGNLYAKTPKALERLLGELRAIGYEVKDVRLEKYNIDRGPGQARLMEKQGWSTWYAHLPDINFGRCGSCGGIISTLGIRAHGHTCELCGATTFSEIRDGSRVRFSFIDHEDKDGALADISFKAKYWDVAEGYLYLYPTVGDGLWLRGERAVRYFESHSDKWELVVKFGRPFIRIKHVKPWNYDTAVIEMNNIHGHYWNHKSVKIWQGQEVDEFFGRLNIPESINIYESWHQKRLEKSPTLHEKILSAAGQVSDKGWYYQNGTPHFTPGHWKTMSIFVRHFTKLDADAFDLAWPKFRKDGPGGIDDLANFCCDRPQVENKPNIGNLLVGFGKIFNEELTEGEIDAMKLAMSDRDIVSDFSQLLNAVPHS